MKNFSVATLIAQKVDIWACEQKAQSNSVPGVVLEYIARTNKLRQPQIKAIQTRLWLKFVGQNKTLSDLVIEGYLTDSELAQQYGSQKLSHTQQFFVAFAKSNNVPGLGQLAMSKERKKSEWEDDLRKLLGDKCYPNRVYSLPMGAGKTYLMAAFIYLDLHFSKVLENDKRFDKRFAHNFIVLAPYSSKTAILPSLKTIRDFNPEWILPKEDADRVYDELRIEILDKFKTKKKSMQVNNPNLDKVNRMIQRHERGLVFITNAEKVVLEKIQNSTDEIKVNFGIKEKDEVKKHNELRDCMANIPALSVFLDEAHHTYTRTANKEKKLRSAVEVLNLKYNLREVDGFSGTPFNKSNINIGPYTIKAKQLQDVLYNYPLAMGIGVFLKTPKVVSRVGVLEKSFIAKALKEFFHDYDVSYANGTKSKIAFYCPSIKALNENILPAVQKWYDKNRLGKNDEILSYYATPRDKEINKQYPLPPEALADFHNLDSSHSKKRVVLLVAVGTEGWDCRSLTAVALPRKTTTTNFVLQTSCRCLREVVCAQNEKALIYLGEGNYEILNEQLKEVHGISVDQVQSSESGGVLITPQKSPLGKLKYKQVYSRIVESKRVSGLPKKQLQDFNIKDFMALHPCDNHRQEARIGKRGLQNSIIHRFCSDKNRVSGDKNDTPIESFWVFMVKLQRAFYGTKTAAELDKQYSTELLRIYTQFEKNEEWFAEHPHSELVCAELLRDIAACCVGKRECQQKEVLEDVEIDLLDWKCKSPTIVSGNNFLPDIIEELTVDEIIAIANMRDEKQQSGDIKKLLPNEIAEIAKMRFETNKNEWDLQDISFNYIPYRFDSNFEKRMILKMLKEGMLADLELYYNGMRHSELCSFFIQTSGGKYTPDFLLIKREGKPYQKGGRAPISKVLIIETKGQIFYDDSFKAKEKFIDKRFLPNNLHFKYICFTDGKDDYKGKLETFRDNVENWLKCGKTKGAKQ